MNDIEELKQDIGQRRLDPEIRLSFAWDVGRVSGPTGLAALQQALGDHDSWVRVACATGLEQGQQRSGWRALSDGMLGPP